MDSSLRSGGGRRKIPIVKIEKKEAGGLTFSKRRQGLFKKASDLSVLCGVDVAVLALSEAENPYCYASTPSLIRRILSTSPPAPSSSSSSDNVDELWWEEEPIERMSLDELRVFRGQLAREMQSIEAEEEGFSRSRP
ncbi:uncharacterized protein A4U43_C04F26140 [Asparagus officinalis]|uniref:MADS-box domain-containing protein n=1 Tax=Asparagus officinalis TaxID=4686 RepID=A0A5P1F3S8_ASPOF|nr:MADS-box transcription factor 23-like [Asparagus officinalis]XP_020263125.1 MADS-box transcription factor 23-like [Asparagus officinalis]ONK71768.1 uncharacterized protein A4U43_C04F12190 [Asparagus officinalis]ONK73015.1 uncharacterized protein A4U43_C04F26140 [Asparagus officinalis]